MPTHIVNATHNCAQTPTLCGRPRMTVTATGPAETVRGVLRHEYGRFRNGIKLLALAAGVSPRTAESWLNGRAAPNLQNLIPLMSNCDALATAILQLVEERKNARLDNS